MAWARSPHRRARWHQARQAKQRVRQRRPTPSSVARTCSGEAAERAGGSLAAPREPILSSCRKRAAMGPWEDARANGKLSTPLPTWLRLWRTRVAFCGGTNRRANCGRGTSTTPAPSASPPIQLRRLACWTDASTGDTPGGPSVASPCQWASRRHRASSLSPLLATVSPKQVGVMLSATCEASNNCSADWRLVGAANVNGDGHVDLLWHNYQGTYPGATPGTLRNWLLDGNGGVTGHQDLSQQCGANCAPAWTALGYAYFPQSP